jgi:serine/threonine-protein kinase
MALPAAVLTLRAATVAFSSTPSGASVTLVRGTERRAVGTTPISADVDVSGGAWIVQLERSGYRDYEAPLVIAAGQPTGSFVATMDEAPRGGGASRPPPPPQSTTVAITPPRIGARVGPPAAPTTTTASAGGGGGGTGTLRINTRPWSQVFVDGRLIGNTPQMNISLPAGRHSVTLVNSEFNIRETITVEITAGATETRSLTLTPG